MLQVYLLSHDGKVYHSKFLVNWQVGRRAEKSKSADNAQNENKLLQEIILRFTKVLHTHIGGNIGITVGAQVKVHPIHITLVNGQMFQ